ncbi:NlpC/P60 family protein [Erwinia sp. V71]|uniref:NlpC/P60 family protein n=1 Tax=Erwinia sp. V71 TaxID=3369424 RepID=UPI003F5E03D9
MNFKFLSLLAVTSVLALSGCSGHKAKPDVKQTVERSNAAQPDLIPVLAALHDQMHTWQDTPYQWGGTQLSGVDCSGFVWRPLKDRFNLPVERLTTHELLTMGKPVAENKLQTGDLVFFRNDGGMHVGFYDTSHHFFLASVSKGVIRSSLDNPYWQSVYYQARRLPNELNGQITLNAEEQHLARNN